MGETVDDGQYGSYPSVNLLSANYFNTQSIVAPTYTRKYDLNTFPSNTILKADTGSTNTYLQDCHRRYLEDLKTLQQGPIVTLPDGSTIKASKTGLLSLHHSLPLSAYVFPQLQSESLLSIGQLCDAGCIAIFDKIKLSIYKDGRLLLSGRQNPNDGLWDVPFDQNHTNKMNYIISKDKSKTELAQYLHGCAFSPSLKTLQDAVDQGNFSSWPVITDLNLKNF